MANLKIDSNALLISTAMMLQEQNRREKEKGNPFMIITSDKPDESFHVASCGTGKELLDMIGYAMSAVLKNFKGEGIPYSVAEREFQKLLDKALMEQYAEADLVKDLDEQLEKLMNALNKREGSAKEEGEDE